MDTGIIVAAFPSRKSLIRALEHLIDDDVVDILRAAIVARAETGETVIVEDTVTPGEGSIVGAALGVIAAVLGVMQLGALALPTLSAVVALLSAAALGGLIGHFAGLLVANWRNDGFDNTQITALGDHLKETRLALVIEVESPEDALRKLREALKGYRADLIEPLYRALLPEPPAIKTS